MDVQVVAPAAAGQQAEHPAALPHGDASAKTQTAQSSQPEASGALSPLVAKMFSQASGPDASDVNVSYRVEHEPNMVVMVFTDPHTGQEISQVPAEVVVQLAQFFDKQSGVAVDKSA